MKNSLRLLCAALALAAPVYAQDPAGPPAPIASVARQDPGVRHGPAQDATFVTAEENDRLRAFRVGSSLKGTKSDTAPLRIQYALQVPEQADVASISLFLDHELITPWEVDGRVVGFHPAPHLADRIDTVFMAARNGMRWCAFESDPIWADRGGEADVGVIDERFVVSVSFTNYPSAAEIGRHRLNLYRGTDAQDGSRTITSWWAYPTPAAESRLEWSWVGGLVLLSSLVFGLRSACGIQRDRRASKLEPA